MQNVFNCLDELKRFKEIPPNTIVIEERNGKTVTWQQIPSEQTDGYDIHGSRYPLNKQMGMIQVQIILLVIRAIPIRFIDTAV